MRIVHVIIGLNIGGAELALKKLILNDSENHHSVICLTTSGSLGGIFSAKNIDVVSLGLNRVNVILVLMKLVVRFRKLKPDVVQTWMYHSDVLGGIAARLAGRRRICWNVRNTEIPQAKFSFSWFLVRLCAVLSYFIPQKIICCAFAARDFHVAMGFNREIMVVVPNGFEFDVNVPDLGCDFPTLRAKLEIPRDVLLVGMVGRYDILKGFDIFVEAANIILRVYSKEVKFVCIGRGVDYQNRNLLSLIDSYNLRDSFYLVGEVANLAPYFSLMDIFCLASRAEGFPNVLVEAMLASLPCVVTDVGDAARIVGSHGIVVERNNAPLLAQGLISYLRDGHVRRVEDGSRLRVRAIQSFGISTTVRRYHDIYKSIA